MILLHLALATSLIVLLEHI